MRFHFSRPILAALLLVSSALSAATPPPPAAPAESADFPLVDGYLQVGFDRLATFPFTAPPINESGANPTPPTPAVVDQIPAEIKRLDGRKVTLTGFMLPVKLEHGLAVEFLLMNSQMICCFGTTPPTNSWVTVRMPKGTAPLQDTPLAFSGTFHVREHWESGWLASIYQLDAEK